MWNSFWGRGKSEKEKEKKKPNVLVYWNLLYWKAGPNLLVKISTWCVFSAVTGDEWLGLTKLPARSYWEGSSDLGRKWDPRMFPESVRQLIWFTSIAFQRAKISSAAPKHSFGVKPHYFKWNPSVKLFIKYTVTNMDRKPIAELRDHRWRPDRRMH